MTTTRSAAPPGQARLHTARERGDVARGGDAPVLDVAVPVHNEEAGLDAGVRRLHTYLTGTFPYTFRITIADNASTTACCGAPAALQRQGGHGHGRLQRRRPVPTLARFKKYVAEGKITYYIPGMGPGPGRPSSSRGDAGTSSRTPSGHGSSRDGGDAGTPGGGPGRSGSASRITAWVTSHYASTKAGGQTLYNLTQPK